MNMRLEILGLEARQNSNKLAQGWRMRVPQIINGTHPFYSAWWFITKYFKMKIPESKLRSYDMGTHVLPLEV
jgi:hypothetical protein